MKPHVLNRLQSRKLMKNSLTRYQKRVEFLKAVVRSFAIFGFYQNFTGLLGSLQNKYDADNRNVINLTDLRKEINQTWTLQKIASKQKKLLLDSNS